MNAALRKWVPALAPALLVLLLGVQVLLGARGFSDPHSGPLGALELPGRLLGWGGVALLLPLLAWLLLGWWGFDVTGMALKTLGALTLGLAVGGLASLWGGEAQGGLIGGPLGGLLADALPGFLATVLLLLMLVPGALLASARFQLGARTTVAGAGPGAPKPRNSPSLKAPTRESGSRHPHGWYPEKRYDAQGNELPMTFGGASDVGSIRFRDGAGEAGDAQPPTPPPEPSAAPAEAAGDDALPSTSKRGPGGWPQGLVADPEDAAQEAREPADDEPEGQDVEDVGPVHVRDNRTETPPSRRALAAPPPAALRPPAAAPAPPTPPAAPTKVFSRQLFPKNPGDAVLLPGVRYRDEAAPPPQPPEPQPLEPQPLEPQAPAPSPSAAQAPTSAPRARKAAAAPPTAVPALSASPKAASPKAAAPKPAPARLASPKSAPPLAVEPSPLGPPSVPYVRAMPPATEEDSISRALEPLGDMAAMARYRKKLEASGIFAGSAEGGEPTQAAPKEAEGKAAAQSRLQRAGEERRKQSAAPLRTPAVQPTPAVPAAKAAPANALPAAPAVQAGSAKAAGPEKQPTSERPEKPRASKPLKAETGQLFETEGSESEPPETAKASPPVTTKAPSPGKKPVAKLAAKPPRGAWVEELKDAAFLQAVEAAVERGTASAVLLTRRMGLGYARAQALVERLALTGVVGEVGPNGSRPVLIRAEDLEAARPKPA